MAINVAKAGFPLIVFDIRPEPVKELVDKGAVYQVKTRLMWPGNQNM